MKITNPVAFATFSNAYRAGLAAEVAVNADKYAWPAADAEKVANKMLDAMLVNPGSVNYDGGGMRRACKALGIKFTRKAIFEYLGVA